MLHRQLISGLAVAAALLSAPIAEAANYRIYFKGSEALAMQSPGPAVAAVAVPGPPAIAVAAPPAPSLSAPVPTSAAVAAIPAVPVPRAAAYVAPGPPPGNLSASCPTCVPGGTTSANYGAGVPNQIVTFLHPYTNKAVTVPLTLPVGKPRIHTYADRIVYDYGLLSYKVIIKFLPDGEVRVGYRG